MKVRIYKLNDRYFARIKKVKNSNCNNCDMSEGRLCTYHIGVPCCWESLYKEGTINKDEKTFTSLDGTVKDTPYKKNVYEPIKVVERNHDGKLLIGGVEHEIEKLQGGNVDCPSCPLYHHDCAGVLDSLFGSTRSICGTEIFYKIKVKED